MTEMRKMEVKATCWDALYKQLTEQPVGYIMLSNKQIAEIMMEAEKVEMRRVDDALLLKGLK